MRASVFFVFLVCASFMSLPPPDAYAQEPRFEYRVVFASVKKLAAQLAEAGRQGYACALVARAEPGAKLPGVVVLLARRAGSTGPAVVHHVIEGGSRGGDLQPLLEREGAAGLRLCGVVLDEEQPGPSLVAVMSQRAGQNQPWGYGVEVLSNYKNSLVRLNTAGRDGFLPVAAEAIDDSRDPERRSWMVVTERPSSGRQPSEIAVRSASGPDRLQRALNEQAGQGYRVDLIWKEASDIVAMMSHPLNGAKPSASYAAEAMAPSRIHLLSGLYLGDFPYLTGGDRLVVSDRSVSSSSDLEEDPLPPLSRLGYADALDLEVLGNHISRHRGYEAMSARIHPGERGKFVLTTVITQRAR